MRWLCTIAAVAFTMSVQVAMADKLDFFDKTFVSGNDVYQWCQGNRPMALAFTAALSDGAAHSVWVLETMRPELLVSTERPRAAARVAHVEFNFAILTL
jgi:hypothetical protein